VAKIKLKLKNVSKLSRKERTRLGQAIKRSGVMESIAEDVIKVSKKAKRKGLTKKWSEYRDKLAAKNSTDPEYGSGKSNLTFTGGLLNSIKAKFVVGKFLIRLEPTGTHSLYKRLTKRKTKTKRKRSKNQDIALGQEKMGRPVIIITDKTIKKYSKWIRQRVGKLFTR